MTLRRSIANRIRSWRPAVAGLGLLAALGAGPAESPAQTGGEKKTLSIPEVVAAVRPSVVSILTRGIPSHPFQQATPPGSGSGLILDEQGHVLTNHHLVGSSTNVVVGLPEGRLTPGRVVAKDFLLDLAVVKITAHDLAPARLGYSSELRIGETVVAIGNPFALKGGSTVTVGVVSALDRAILAPNGETLYNLIQTDAAINPGNSGGPLVDRSGRVVGLNVAIAPSAQAISYAIAIDAIYPYIQSMLVRGAVLRPDLGAIFLTVTPSVVASFDLEIERGVLVAQVQPGSSSGVAGLATGDVITAVDHHQIHNVADFWHAYMESDDRRPAELGVYGKEGEAVVSLPRPPPPAAAR